MQILYINNTETCETIDQRTISIIFRLIYLNNFLEPVHNSQANRISGYIFLERYQVQTNASIPTDQCLV
ncbi:hypothetical protein D3C78_1540420 [compost metagenome]